MISTQASGPVLTLSSPATLPTRGDCRVCGQSVPLAYAGFDTKNPLFFKPTTVEITEQSVLTLAVSADK